MPGDSLSIVGYHGTLSDRARNIFEQGFHASAKEIEWLGHGVYFFTSYHHAEAWARQEYARQRRRYDKVSDPVVLQVNLHLKPNGLLDLDRKDTMNFFLKELRWGDRQMCGAEGGRGAPRFQDDREQRCFWCNYFARTHPDVQVIAFSFPRINYGDRDFGFPTVHSQRQLCVMDHSCIEMPPGQMEVTIC